MSGDVTVAEEHFARLIAHCHGATPLFRRPADSTTQTVASLAGGGTGWAWEVDNYVNRHWREYIGAARAVIDARDST